MKNANTFNPVAEAVHLHEICQGVMQLSPASGQLKASNPDVKQLSDADSHFHERLEIRLLFGHGHAGQVDYQDIREILLSPPQVFHRSLPVKELFAHITLRLDEISLYYMRGRNTAVTLPWGKLAGELGLHMPSFLAACQHFCRGETVPPEHLLHLLRLFFSTLERLFTSPQTRWDNNPAENIVRYIQEHYYRSDLTIREVARLMHCSPNYIQQIFHRRLNCTPIEYLIRVRLENARKLLLTHQYRIKEVASLCGWNYVHYFDRRYRERFGHLPSEE